MIRSRLAALASSVFVIALAVGLTAAPAFAVVRWTIHNGNDASLMNVPPGGSEGQTCSNRVSGTSGWSTVVADPPNFEPLPPEATTAATYEVWKAPPGFTNFAEAQEDVDPITFETIGYSFIDPVTFDPIPATLVKRFTTAARTALTTPIAVNDGSPGDTFIFTTAPFDEALSGVNPGDALGLKPTGGATFINLAAIACSATSQYSFGGFQSPVDDPPTVNIGTAGKSYLARFQLRDSSGAIVSSLSAVSSVASNRVDCATFGSQPTDVLEQSTTGKSSLWYSSTTHRYVYRWKTSTTPGCFQLLFTFRTGQTETALFKLK